MEYFIDVDVTEIMAMVQLAENNGFKMTYERDGLNFRIIFTKELKEGDDAGNRSVC